MKKLTQKILKMEGTKRRVGDIKAIYQNIECSVKLLHVSLISTNNCVTFLYSWGHMIIYTFPQDKVITIEFLYPIWNDKIDKVIKASIDIFQPETHNIKEVKRC